MKKRIGFKSLKKRIKFWFLFVSITPLFIGTLICYQQSVHYLRAESFNKLMAIRDLKVEQLNAWFDERLGDITTISQDFEIRDINKPATKTHHNSKNKETMSNARKLLNRYLKNYHDYVELFIINPFSGIIEVSTDLSQEGKDKSEDLYFTEPLKKRVPYIKDIYFSKTLNKPSISFSIPINCLSHNAKHNAKHIVGILVARIEPDISLYPLLLNRTGMGETGETLLVNKDVTALNELIWYKDAPLKLKIEAKPAIYASRGETGIIETMDYRGKEVLAAYTHIPRAGWGFVAKQDLKEVYRPAQALALNLLVIVLISSALVYWLAVLLAKRIAQPVIAMAENAKKIRSGDLSIRNRVQSKDELGYLAETLNKMTDEISSHITSIKKAKTELQKEKNSLEQAVEKRTETLQQELKGRKLAEDALLESEREKSNILNSMSDGLILHDRELRNIWVNKIAAESVDSSPDDLAGLYCYSIWFDRKEPCENCPIVKTFETGKPQAGEVILPNGSVYMTYGYPVFDSKGCLTRVIELSREITEQKKLEARIQQAQKMEAIGTLAGGIAHDFNNILSAIIGYTELSIDCVEQGALIQKNLHQILTAGNRAADLVNQILAFSRQSEPELRPTQIKLIATEVLKLLRASLPVMIKINSNIQSDSMVFADPTEIHQILMNLCTNAGHAMEENGGDLEVTLINVDINEDFISMHPEKIIPGTYIKLSVSDTGYGITPDLMNRIFDPFFTTKAKGEGTGMGLSVVHGIVKKYSGLITVYSEPKKRTTFNIFLPVIVDSTEKEDVNIEEPMQMGNEHILFVDDEKPLADMGSQILKFQGYAVTTRTSSIEALGLFKTQPERFDLIITDMNMPNMTGIELAREIIEIRPDIPVILCTGYSAKLDAEKARKMGIRALIMKPILQQELAKTIREVLDV